MRIVVVGSGRVGSALGEAIADAGHTVAWAAREGPLPSGDLVIAAVPDGAIAAIACRLPAGIPAVHCAGSLGPEALAPHRPAGTFHPLMTFPGGTRPELRGVGAAIAGDPAAVLAATELASSLGMRPFRPPADRALYHAAAVIAGNYATVLLAEATRVLEAAGLADAGELLLPLVIESVTNAARHPGRAITGPAARGETVTLDRHRDALVRAGLPDLIPLYDELAARARVMALSGAFTAERNQLS